MTVSELIPIILYALLVLLLIPAAFALYIWFIFHRGKIIEIYKNMTFKIRSFFLMLFFSSSSNAAEKYPDYHNLSEDAAESRSFEIRKIKHGTLSNEVLFDTQEKTFIIKRGFGSGDRYDYWKINRKGYVIDSFYHDSHLFPSGVFYDKDTYNDWAISGNKNRQHYASILDADAMSEAELKSYLDKADIVDFGVDYENNKARFYVRIDNKWLVLESAKRFDSFENAYGKDYYEVAAKGYAKKNADRLLHLKDYIKPFQKWENQNNIIYLQYFDKKGYKSAPFMDINSHGWEGDYGTGYFQIRHYNELLNFKAFTSRRDGFGFDPNIMFYTLPNEYQDEVKVSLIQLVGRPYNMRSSKEFGMYAIREKIDTDPESITEYEKTGISFGTYKMLEAKFNWQPVIKGFTPDRGELRSVAFFSGTEESFNTPFSSPVELKSRPIPSEITFLWNGPENSKEDYYISLNGEIYEWDISNNGIFLKIFFNDIELIKVFQQLEEEGTPIKLELKAETVDENSAFLSVHFNNDKQSIPVKRIKVKTVGNSFHFNEAKLTRHFERGRLKIAYEAADTDSAKVPGFMQDSQFIAAHSDYSEQHARYFEFYTAKLIFKSLKEQDTAVTKSVAHHYINNIFPHSGPGKTHLDLSSTILAICVKISDDKLCNGVFSVLIPGLDIDTLEHKNLLFNLACYYSKKKDKAKMLRAIKLALKHGNLPEKFNQDEDFEAYLNDADFLKVLQKSQ